MPAVSLVLFLTSTVPAADHWPSFRGDGTSVSQATALPVKWSPTEGIAWRISVPGYGQSSPIVWKGRAFLSSVDGPNKDIGIVSAFDLATGKLLWKKEYPTSQKQKSSPTVSRAAPTGVVDADRVIELFESGDLVCLDHQGKERWKRALTTEFGAWENNHGMASSLAQDGERVFVLADHRGRSSWLMAIDKATGSTAWKIDRKPNSSWTSPIVATIQGQEQVIISSAGAVEAFSPTDGKSLWKMADFAGNTIASPVAAGNRIIVATGESRAKPDPAVTTHSTGAILVESSGPVHQWEAKKAISQHASPLVYQGVAYFVTRTGMVHAHDLESGRELFVERLADPCWATPIGAGGRIYFFGKNGTTTILKAGSTPIREGVCRLWDEAEFARRKEEEKKKPENQSGFGRPATGANSDQAKANPSEGKRPSTPTTGQPKGNAAPAMSMGYDAVGDVVYGVAAVDGMWIVRTGTELICIKAASAR